MAFFDKLKAKAKEVQSSVGEFVAEAQARGEEIQVQEAEKKAAELELYGEERMSFGISTFYVSGNPNYDSELDERDMPEMEIQPFEKAIRFRKYSLVDRMPFFIMNDDIQGIQLQDQEQIYKTKDKSVLGRAVVGGLLFGQAGATVGAISGVRSKKEKVKMDNLFLTIDYLDGEEPRCLSLSVKFSKKDKVKKFFSKHYPRKFATVK